MQENFQLTSNVWFQGRKLTQISSISDCHLQQKKQVLLFLLLPQHLVCLAKKIMYKSLATLQGKPKHPLCRLAFSHSAAESPINFRGRRILTTVTPQSVCDSSYLSSRPFTKLPPLFPFSSEKFFQKLNSKNRTKFWCFFPFKWLVEQHINHVSQMVQA